MLYRQDLRILDLFFENTKEPLLRAYLRIGENSDEYDGFNGLLWNDDQYNRQVYDDIRRSNQYSKNSEFNKYTELYQQRNRSFKFTHVPDLGNRFMHIIRTVCWSFFPNDDSACYKLFKNVIFEDTDDDSVFNYHPNNSLERRSIENDYAIYGPRRNENNEYKPMSSLRLSSTLYDIIQHITLSLMAEKLLLTFDDKTYAINEEGQNNRKNYSRNIKNNVGLFLQNRDRKNDRRNNFNRLNVHLARAIRSRAEKDSLFRTGTEFDFKDIDNFKWMEETIKIYDEYVDSYENSVMPMGDHLKDYESECSWRELVFEDYSKLYSVASFYKHMEEGCLKHFLVSINDDKYMQLYHRLLLQLILLCPYPLNTWLEKAILHDGGLLHKNGSISKELLLELIDYMYRIIFCILPGIDYAVKEAIKDIDSKSRMQLLEESFGNLKTINMKLLANNLKFDKKSIIPSKESLIRELDIALGYDTHNKQSFIDDFVKRKAVVWASYKPQTINYLDSLTGVTSLIDCITRLKFKEDSITPLNYISKEMRQLIEGIYESIVECDKNRLSFYKDYYNYEVKPLAGELSERDKEREALYTKCKEVISLHIAKDKIYLVMINLFGIYGYNDLKKTCSIIDFVYDILEHWIIYEEDGSWYCPRGIDEARLGVLVAPSNVLRDCSDRLSIEGEQEQKKIVEKFHSLNNLLNLTCRTRWENMDKNSYSQSFYEINDIRCDENGEYSFNAEQAFAIQMKDILLHIFEYFKYGENLETSKIVQGYQMHWCRHMSFKTEEL